MIIHNINKQLVTKQMVSEKQPFNKAAGQSIIHYDLQ